MLSHVVLSPCQKFASENKGTCFCLKLLHTGNMQTVCFNGRLQMCYVFVQKAPRHLVILWRLGNRRVFKRNSQLWSKVKFLLLASHELSKENRERIFYKSNVPQPFRSFWSSQLLNTPNHHNYLCDSRGLSKRSRFSWSFVMLCANSRTLGDQRRIQIF